MRWSGQYGSFGEVSHQTAESWALRQGKPTINQPLRYAGQYADSETGLHYNLFRYYDPGVGRFTSQDPIGLNGGLNLYQYAPNPLGWVDPLGLSSCPIKAGRNRRMAMNKAKDTAGIPRSQQHESHWQVGNNRQRQGYSNYVYSENPAEFGNFYQYRNAEGHKVVVVEHTSDPRNKIGDAHFHAGKAKTSPYSYDFKTERDGKVPADSSGGHHIYYDY
ncbi:RHS repeat-associated core domain-containing protein [Jejubacter sp. L23]